MPRNGDDFQYATGVAPGSAGIPAFRIAGFHPASSAKSLANDLMKLRDPFAFVSAPTGKSATRQLESLRYEIWSFSFGKSRFLWDDLKHNSVLECKE